jgi:RNA polymerase sigma-70 factor (ECF subfamily)
MLARMHLPAALRQRLEPADVVQETFLLAQEHVGQFEGSTAAEYAGWLRTILGRVLTCAARKWSAQMRTTSREISLDARLERSSLHLEQFLVADQSSPSRQALRNETAGKLRVALDQLPEDQRQAVELKYFSGLTVEEICRETGRTTASVAGLLRRGMKRLRELLPPQR